MDPPIPADQIFYLINATYFNAKWKFPFVANYSHNDDFTPEGKASVKVPTMVQTAYYRTFEDQQGAKYLELPYEGDTVSMFIALPPEGVGLKEFVHNLTFVQWKTITDTLAQQTAGEVRLYLPKLEFSYDSELITSLAAMGMRRAFNASQAEFDDFSDIKPLFINLVKQVSYLRVDEKGTEAAAVTVVGGAGGAAPHHVPEFRVDRPYLFSIQDKTTGAILFIGSINEPEGGKLPQERD